jgi:hypothetical protein
MSRRVCYVCGPRWRPFWRRGGCEHRGVSWPPARVWDIGARQWVSFP